MEIEKSRNGFYTVTFLNKSNLDEKEIYKEFSTVGNVCNIVHNFQRVFIRFKEKEEAERAIKKFGKVYDVDMAKNNKISDNQQFEGGIGHTHNHTNNTSYNYNHKAFNNHSAPFVPTPEVPNVTQSMEKLNLTNKTFHLILANLPKNYTIKDVNGLVEEAKPVFINQLDETRVFNIKFCHIVLDSIENLTYLVEKLNGFVICGEKLIAAEAKYLLEWRERVSTYRN